MNQHCLGKEKLQIIMRQVSYVPNFFLEKSS
jgi:hypothetical protein